MSLTRAIDAVIVFVDSYLNRYDAWRSANPVQKWNDPVPDSYPRFDTEQFEQLARTIRVEAEKLGLGDRLPPPEGSECLSQVNLPGAWMLFTGFHPMPTGRWRDAMLTLRAF